MKLRFVTDSDGARARIDNVSLQTEVPRWTLSNAYNVRVTSDASSIAGAYLYISNSNQWAMSSLFVVPTTVQQARFDYAAGTDRNSAEQVRLYAEVVDEDTAATTILGTLAASKDQGWQATTLDLSAFRGRAVKLRFRSDDQGDPQVRAKIDNISFVTGVDAPPLGWDYRPSNLVQIDGANQSLLSAPVTVLSNTNTVRFDYMAWTPRNATEQIQLYVEVLSGANFANTTRIYTALGSAVQGWQEGVEANLQAFQGQVIKLRFRVDDDGGRNARVRIDQVTLVDPTFRSLAATEPPRSSSACTPHEVKFGADQAVSVRTPNEKYIIRILNADANPQAVLRIALAGKVYWLSGKGAALGGNLPQGVDAILYTVSTYHHPNNGRSIWAEVCSFGDWQDLISFRPNTDLQRAVLSRPHVTGVFIDYPPCIHQLEQGMGDINFDYYPVRINGISAFPLKPADPDGAPFGARNSERYSPSEFMEFVRTHLNDFIDLSKADFTPYSRYYVGQFPNPGNDEPWFTNSPRGTVISINVTPTAKWYQIYERAAVLTADHSLDNNDAYWRFSSIFIGGDATHPVSGNRQFGIKRDGNTWVFYTRGSDRATGLPYYLGSNTIFTNADQLWQSLQRSITNFVNNPRYGGTENNAQIEPRDWFRYQSLAVLQTYWQPTTPWIDIKPNVCQNNPSYN